jgi:hypothetical protein
MATTTKTRRSRERATSRTTEPAATEPAATETPAEATPAETTPPETAPAEASQPAPDTNDTPAAPDSEPTQPNGQTTPQAPATGPDPYVMIVAGQLAGKPDGTTGPDLVKLVGLAPGKTAVVLAAMENAGAAVRVPAEEPDGEDRWILNDPDQVSTVDLSTVPTHCVCKCGHTHRRQVTVTVTGRRGGTPGTNGDGARRFGKGELERTVRDFVRDNPGHQFSDTDIARELTQRLNRKVHNGAVYVATNNLVAKGELALANPTNPRDRRETAPTAAGEHATT